MKYFLNFTLMRKKFCFLLMFFFFVQILNRKSYGIDGVFTYGGRSEQEQGSLANEPSKIQCRQMLRTYQMQQKIKSAKPAKSAPSLSVNPAEKFIKENLKIPVKGNVPKTFSTGTVGQPSRITIAPEVEIGSIDAKNENFTINGKPSYELREENLKICKKKYPDLVP